MRGWGDEANREPSSSDLPLLLIPSSPHLPISPSPCPRVRPPSFANPAAAKYTHALLVAVREIDPFKGSDTLFPRGKPACLEN